MSKPTLQSLLARFSQPGSAISTDLNQLLADVVMLLEALPPDGNLDFLKKPGAWRTKPLPANLPTNPNYVTVPCNIEIVDLTPAQLAAQLRFITPTADPYGNALVTFHPLLK